MSQATVDEHEVASVLDGDDRIYEALQEAVHRHEEKQDSERWQEYDIAGFTYDDLGASPWVLTELKKAGILDQTYGSSNSPNQYRVADLETARRALILAGDEVTSPDTAEDDMDAPEPHELFLDVVGHDEMISWFRRTIDRHADVHHLLVGEPGTGKSTITDEILRLPDTSLVVGAGSQSRAAGIVQTLVEERPTFLVVEEIEKMPKSDAEALLTLAGRGYIKQTKGDSTSNQRIEMDTTVFATANDRSKVSPDSLVSRFMEWRFEAYAATEFQEVCRGVLPRKHDTDESLAEYIAGEIHDRLGTTNPREAERIAQLADDRGDVDDLIMAMQ
jgi:hypothetical protein